MTSMYVPEPVISLSVKPTDQRAQDSMGKALGRFVREDPTFRSWVDHESAETVIAGMGELHLEVYIERMRREYRCEVEVGAPCVAYRECISRRAEFDYVHKKQSGGSGQYARVAGYFEPSGEAGDLEFENKIRGGAIPVDYISACEKGFRSSLEKGRLIGAPVTGLRVVLNDGKSHSVDSSDIAFQAASRGAFAEAYAKAGPVVLEPLMLLNIEGPAEYQGAYIRTVMQRRGQIAGTLEEDGFCRVEAEVPLAEMFGYATELRSASQGKAEFTLEFARYARVPAEVQKALIEKHLEK